MGVRLLTIGILLYSAVATAQLSGQFYMEKESYNLGEPIFLYFRVVNDGKKAETLEVEDHTSSGCSPYTIRVARDWPTETHHSSSCRAQALRALSMICGGRKTTLQPGETYVDHVLLNFGHNVDAAGGYSVGASSGDRGTGAHAVSNATLRFLVQAKPADKKVFQPWIDRLRSTDGMERLEAANLLANIAPPSLEDLLLTFAEDPSVQNYAPLAFHRLNSPRSIAALKWLSENSRDAWVQQQASDYLANDACRGDFWP